jgi:hypothetical protein
VRHSEGRADDGEESDGEGGGAHLCNGRVIGIG